MSRPVREKTAVMLVMAECDPALDGIRRQLAQLDVTLRLAPNLHEFRELVGEGQPVQVIISGVSLPDGNWCDVLSSTVRAALPARVLICSRTADERFWSEAIWRGVHDILVEPFTIEYLQRSVEQRFEDGQTGGTEELPPPRGRKKARTFGAYRSAPAEAAAVFV